MPLKLTITSFQRLSPGQETTKTLDRGSLSIGRAAQSDWTLQDPERILSGRHCTVHFQDGGYFLTDTSTNGVYLNESEQRIGRNQSVRLQDGDHFVLGEYEIAVSLQSRADGSAVIEPEGPTTDVVRVPDILLPAAGAVSLGGGSQDPGKPSFASILAEDRDGLDLQPSAGPPVKGAVVTEPPADLTAPDRAAFEPPALIPETPPPPEPAPAAPPPESSEAGAESFIPEDLDFLTGLPVAPPAAPVPAFRPPPEQPVAPPPAAPVPAFRPPPEQPVAPPPAAPVPAFRPPPEQPVAPPPPPPPPAAPRPAVPPAQERGAELTGPGAEVLLRAFLEGAGLPHLRLTDDQLPELMANLGAIFRETVRGLMVILLARSDIKGEFRLDRTAIGPMENNPLKTPPGQPPLRPEEVMTLLLVRQKDAYMSPVQAVREGFKDIKDHQVAVWAGVQAALNRLLERFDPGNLETRLGQSMLDNLWPANRKAKYWDLFTAEYRAIAREAEDDFNKLFGDEFAHAYEERLRAR